MFVDGVKSKLESWCHVDSFVVASSPLRALRLRVANIVGGLGSERASISTRTA